MSVSLGVPFPRLIDSDEQALLRETVAKIAQRTRGDDGSSIWQALATAGLTQLRYPDDAGSSYGGAGDVVIVVEESSRFLSNGPLVSGLLAPELLRLAGVGAADVVDMLGDRPTGLVLSQDLDSVGPATPGALAWDAGPAERALGIEAETIALIELGAAIETGDITRTSRRATGSATRITSLAGAGHGRFEVLARLAVAADTLGLARSVLESAVEYAGERIQFGVPVGSFQAVQHLCADAYVRLEALRSSIVYAAWAYDAGRDDAEHAVDVAKAYSNSAGPAIVNAATQVFGGIAITWEHDAHRALRRALVNREILGSDRAVLERLGRGAED